MKTNISIVLSILCFSITALAADGIRKYSLPAIQNFAVEQEITVAATGSVSSIPGGNRSESDDAPGKSAALLNETGVLWQWQPSPLTSHATGGADLTDAAVSPDESTVVMVERVGGIDAPNSSRLIFVSLGSGRILRITDLPKRRIIAVKWQEGNRLYLLQEAQECFSSPSVFAVLALPDMRIIAESSPLNGKVTSWSIGGGKLFYGIAGDKYFYSLDLNNIPGTAEKSRSRSSDPRVLWMTRSGMLAVYGSSEIEYYQPDYRGIRQLVRTASLPAWIKPLSALEIGKNGDIALLAPDSAAAIITSGVVRRIGRSAGKLFCYSPASSTLLIEQQRLNSFLPCRIPDGVCGKTVSPGKIKPMNRNRNFKAFVLTEKYPAVILIDHRANIFRLDMKSKRPTKRMILETDRTGFR